MMGIDVQHFFRATNPTKTLAIENEEDRKYYIDFSSVRGGPLIQELKDYIAHPMVGRPEEPTCQLFTGHIGCGKSTELLRLKKELQDAGFYVVYFESDDDLELADVDVGDILLAIASRVYKDLEDSQLELQPRRFRNLLQQICEIVNLKVDCEVSIPILIAEITASIKDSPSLRDRLRGFVEPQTGRLIDTINSELISSSSKV